MNRFLAHNRLFVRQSFNVLYRGNDKTYSKSTSKDGGTNDMIDSEYNLELLAPKYVERGPETVDVKKARLLYQSRKRGMLENGLLLGTFAAKYLRNLNDTQLEQYDKLINEPSNDWDIFYWSTGVKETPPQYNNDIMDLLKKHVRNDEREYRIRQPDLQ